MTSQHIQYIAVCAILVAVIGWLLYSFFRKKPGGSSGCCGCSLSDACKKRDLMDIRKDGKTSCSDFAGRCPEEDESE